MQFKQAIQALSDSGADFVVIGGVAAMLHGSDRFTSDLDIFYSRAKTNLTRLRDALAPFHPRPRGFPPELPFVWDEATLRNSSVLTLETDIGNVDLLAEVAGLGPYEEIKARAKLADAFGRCVALLDIRSLILVKRTVGRDKDLLVIPELESLMEAEETAE
jgi:predicted nucleotidyltransferase